MRALSLLRYEVYFIYGLLAGITSVVALSIILLNFGQPRHSSLHNLVSATHRQLKDKLQNIILDKFDGIGGLESDSSLDEDDSNDEKFLSLIGLGSTWEDTKFYSDKGWNNSISPAIVFVSYVSRSTLGEAVGLARNLAHFLRNYTLLIYDIGITSEQLQTLATFCNNTRCNTVKFDLSRFPAHVGDEGLHAFRPLIIQDAAYRWGSIFYLENEQRVSSSQAIGLVKQAEAFGGILSWRSARPVTAQTHPRMIHLLSGGSLLDPFYFTPMVDPSRLIIFNTKELSRKLLLPWVKCCLNHDCILPIGAQSVGCRFDKKPVYRYSGCHGNDASALSVLLGLLYQYEPDRYSLKAEVNSEVTEGSESSPPGATEEPLFRVIGSAEANLELTSLLDNSTDAPTTP